MHSLIPNMKKWAQNSISTISFLGHNLTNMTILQAINLQLSSEMLRQIKPNDIL